MQAGTDDLIADRSTGEIYTANNWEEAGQDFRKIDADGRHLMDARFQVRNGNPNGWPIAVALDGGVLYCSVFTIHEKLPGEAKTFDGGAVLRKFSADKGDPINFPTPGGYVRVKLPDPNEKSVFDHQSLHSIAVCGDSVVAADRDTGTVYQLRQEHRPAPGAVPPRFAGLRRRRPRRAPLDRPFAQQSDGDGPGGETNRRAGGASRANRLHPPRPRRPPVGGRPGGGAGPGLQSRFAREAGEAHAGQDLRPQGGAGRVRAAGGRADPVVRRDARWRVRPRPELRPRLGRHAVLARLPSRWRRRRLAAGRPGVLHQRDLRPAPTGLVHQLPLQRLPPARPRQGRRGSSRAASTRGRSSSSSPPAPRGSSSATAGDTSTPSPASR